MNHLRANVDLLKSYVDLAANVAENKATLPIIGYVLIESKNNTLRLTSTDLETTYMGALNVSSINQGNDWELCLPSKNLKKIVDTLKKQKHETVEIKPSFTDKNHPTVMIGKYKIIGLSRGDYPTFKFDFTNCVFYKAPLDAINFCKPAISLDETRYYLTGIALAENSLVATDGHRLHMVKTNKENYGDGKNDKNNNALLPKKSIDILTSRLFSKHYQGETLVVNWGTETRKRYTAKFPLGEMGELIIRCIEGEFPDFTQVIPQKNNQSIIAEKFELQTIVNEAKVVLNGKKAVDYKGMKITATDDGVQFEAASDPEKGLEYKNHYNENNAIFKGKKLTIGLSVHLLADTLDSLTVAQKDTPLALTFADALSPCRMDYTDNVSSLEFTSVIMPMIV